MKTRRTRISENRKTTLGQLKRLVNERHHFPEVVFPEPGTISPRPWRIEHLSIDDRVCDVLDAKSDVVLSDVRVEDAEIIVKSVNKYDDKDLHESRKTTLTFRQLKKLVNEDSCVSFTGWGMGRNKKESIRRFVEHLHSLEHELENGIIDYDGYPEMVKRSGMDYAFDYFKDDICGWGTETTNLDDALDVNFDIDGEYASLLPDELKPYMEEDSGGYLVFDSERWLKNLFVRVVKGLDR